MTVLEEAYKSHSSSIMSEKNVQPEAEVTTSDTAPPLSSPWHSIGQLAFSAPPPPCFSHKHSFKPLPLLLPELFCRKSRWERFPAVVKGCFRSSWIFCEIYWDKIHILWEEIYSKVTDEHILACKDISVCNFCYTYWRKNFEKKKIIIIWREEFFSQQMVVFGWFLWQFFVFDLWKMMFASGYF